MSVILKIPQELLILIIAMVFANIASAMYFLMLPLYVESLGASIEQVGLFFTIEIISSITMGVVGGWLSDRLGRVLTIGIGAVIGVMAILGMTFAPHWEWLIPAMILSTLGTSLASPSFQAYVGEKAPPENLSTIFGVVDGLYLVCEIIGPLLGGWLVYQFGFRTLFEVASGLVIIAALFRLMMARSVPRHTRSLHPREFVRDTRRLSGLFFASGSLLLWLFLVDGLKDAAYQFAIPFFPKYATEIGNINEGTYGALFAMMSIAGAIAMLPSGMLADRYGEGRVIALGFCLAAVPWFFVIFLPSAPFFFLAFALAGVAYAMITPAFNSLISKSAPPDSLGLVWGILFTTLGAMAVPAPLIGGLLYHRIRPEAPFMMSALCFLVAVPLALWKLEKTMLPTPSVP